MSGITCLPSITSALSVFHQVRNQRLPTISPAVYSAAAKCMVFVAAGTAALFFFPPLSIPLLTVAATIVATRIVIKIGEIYHIEVAERLQLPFGRFRNHHRFIQVAAVIALLVVSALCWQVGCVLAIPFGIYTAIVVGLDFYKTTQSAVRQDEMNSQQPAERAAHLF